MIITEILTASVPVPDLKEQGKCFNFFEGRLVPQLLLLSAIYRQYWSGRGSELVISDRLSFSAVIGHTVSTGVSYWLVQTASENVSLLVGCRSEAQTHG